MSIAESEEQDALAEEPPAWMGLGPTNPQRRPICQGCLAMQPADVRYLACARCKQHYYCSKECQRAHWPVHKVSCNRVVSGPAAEQAELGELLRRWRKKFLVALTGLVHTMLGPNRLRSHIVLMTVAYHRDDRPGFEEAYTEIAAQTEHRTWAAQGRTRLSLDRSAQRCLVCRVACLQIQNPKVVPVASLQRDEPDAYQMVLREQAKLDQLQHNLAQQGMVTTYGTIDMWYKYADQGAPPGGIPCSMSSFTRNPSMQMPPSAEECVAWINMLSRP